MHTTEIAPIDVIEVLTDNGLGLVSQYTADILYCELMRDTATHEYAQQMKKPADFLTKQYAKSNCLFSAWKAIFTMKGRHLHYRMIHVISLAALYIHCTEDMDKDLLQSCKKALSEKDIMKRSCSWQDVRCACLEMEARAKGIHSYCVLNVINYCLRSLISYIVNDPEMITSYDVSKQRVIDDIADMFVKYSKK